MPSCADKSIHWMQKFSSRIKNTETIELTKLTPASELTPLRWVLWDKAPLKAFLYHVFCVSKRFGWLFLKGRGVILQHLPLNLSAGHHCDLLPLSLPSGYPPWSLVASGPAWLSSFLSTDGGSSAGLGSGHVAALG